MTVLVVCVALCHAAVAEAIRVVILHSNDLHGRLFSPEADNAVGDAGGIARAATIIRETKEANPGHVLVVHAGDVLSRGDALTVATRGKLDFRLMKRAGYEVFVPGNGEFYSGVPAILACERASRLPMLYANVAMKATGKRPFLPYLVKTVAGVRIGILGLGVVRMEHPASEPLTYLDPREEASRFVPELKAKSDVVMVLSHLGFKADKELAAAVPGIDLIVGGHSHTKLDVPVRVPRPDGKGMVAIAQAGDYGRHLGRVDLDIERENGTVALTGVEGKLITLDSTVKLDAGIAKTLHRKIAPLMKVVCQNPPELPNPKEGVSPMAQWEAEQIRRATKADVALAERDEDQTPFARRPLTRADLFRAFPYSNQVCLIQMTPDQVRDAVATNKELASTQIPVGKPSLLVAADHFCHQTTASLKPLPCKLTHQRADRVFFRAVRHGWFETEPSTKR